MTTASPMVLVTRKEGFATVTMNRPDKLNAASRAMFQAMGDAFEEVSADSAVRAVVVTGAGKSFCAGADIGGMLVALQKMDPSEFNEFTGAGSRVYRAAYEMEKPVIAAINGHAVGFGIELALVCDIRIAAADARLGEFFVRMGLSTEVGAYLLPRLVGPSRAKLLSFTGDAVTAQEAERIGLVDMVVPPESLLAEAEKLARRLAAGPAAIGVIKRALHESYNSTIESFLHRVMLLQYQLVHTEDHKEAVKAFLEKRPPAFRGK